MRFIQKYYSLGEASLAAEPSPAQFSAVLSKIIWKTQKWVKKLIESLRHVRHLSSMSSVSEEKKTLEIPQI